MRLGALSSWRAVHTTFCAWEAGREYTGVGSHKPVDDNRDRVGQWWYFANIDEGSKGLGSLNFTI